MENLDENNHKDVLNKLSKAYDGGDRNEIRKAYEKAKEAEEDNPIHSGDNLNDGHDDEGYE